MNTRDGSKKMSDQSLWWASVSVAGLYIQNVHVWNCRRNWLSVMQKYTALCPYSLPCWGSAARSPPPSIIADNLWISGWSMLLQMRWPDQRRTSISSPIIFVQHELYLWLRQLKLIQNGDYCHLTSLKVGISACQSDDVAFAEAELCRVLCFVVSNRFHSRWILQRQNTLNST